MTYENAVSIIGAQERSIRKVNGTRFVYDGYEYRIEYRGGFAAYVAIDRRQVGKRNFKYFSGVGAYHCWTVGQVMELVYDKIKQCNAKMEV